MNRSILETELKKVGISLFGWLPVLQCDVCKHRWAPFNPPSGVGPSISGPTTPTARFDYWKCPNKCNETAQVGQEIQTATPRYVVLNDIPGMIFGDEDLSEFERYVHSMDLTEIPNQSS